VHLTDSVLIDSISEKTLADQALAHLAACELCQKRREHISVDVLSKTVAGGSGTVRAPPSDSASAELDLKVEWVKCLQRMIRSSTGAWP
jgi:hypothetical protein